MNKRNEIAEIIKKTYYGNAARIFAFDCLSHHYYTGGLPSSRTLTREAQKRIKAEVKEIIREVESANST